MTLFCFINALQHIYGNQIRVQYVTMHRVMELWTQSKYFWESSVYKAAEAKIPTAVNRNESHQNFIKSILIVEVDGDAESSSQVSSAECY